ncbi:hypothetical protein B566_EDAN016783 [Ephemera danica]|nr:hypothetical protein B566_EDAN016783 [Ephemera danica]
MFDVKKMSSNEINPDAEPLSKRTKCDHHISKESLGIIEESVDAESLIIQSEHLSSHGIQSDLKEESEYVPPECVLIKGEPPIDLEIPETVFVKSEPEAVLVAPVATEKSNSFMGIQDDPVIEKDPSKLTLEELGLKIEEDEEFITPGCSLNITLFAGTKKSTLLSKVNHIVQF